MQRLAVENTEDTSLTGQPSWGTLSTMRARWLYLLAATTGLLRSPAIGAEAATDAPTNPPPVLIAELPLQIRGQPYIRAPRKDSLATLLVPL